MKTETTTETRAPIECRAVLDANVTGGPGKLQGYAALFNTPSQPLPWVETISPGAFSEALAGGADVRALREHDPAKLLGRSTAGTLSLRETPRGLFCEISLPDTELGRDTRAAIARGDLSQMSFGFTCEDDEWGFDDSGQETRRLNRVTPKDVSVVCYPAYNDTTVALRARDRSGHARPSTRGEQLRRWALESTKGEPYD
jgi:HK97 family phage prohead protease